MRFRLRCTQHDVPLKAAEGNPFMVPVGDLWEVDLSDMECPEADACGDSWVIEEVV